MDKQKDVDYIVNPLYLKMRSKRMNDKYIMKKYKATIALQSYRQ